MPIRRPRRTDAPAPTAAVNWDEPLNIGLQYAYPFLEGAGGFVRNVTDRNGGIGGSNINQPPVWVPGPNGTRALFGNGTTGSPSLNTTALHLNWPAATITWWSRPSIPPGMNENAIWGHGTSNSAELSAQIFNGDGNWYIGWNNSPDRRVVVASSSVNAPQGVWSFYAFSWDSTGSYFYHNAGVLLGSNGTAPNVSDFNAPFLIGKQGTYNPSTYNGAFSDLRIWARRLRPQEIARLYTQPWVLFAQPRRRGLAPVVAGTQAQLTQIAAEHWLSAQAQAWMTQVGVEQWASASGVANQAIMTQVALEQWASVAAVQAAAAQARVFILA